jgi:hypothetical protein
MNKNEYLERELDRLLAWIRAADARVSLVLPLSTAMLGALAALGSGVECWKASEITWSTLATVPLFASLVFLVLATFPRTRGPQGSLIFFGGISSRSMEQYREAVRDLDEESYANDLISQCHVNSEIAQQKFKWVKLSLLALFVASIPWLVSVYTLYQVAQS